MEDALRKYIAAVAPGYRIIRLLNYSAEINSVMKRLARSPDRHGVWVDSTGIKEREHPSGPDIREPVQRTLFLLRHSITNIFKAHQIRWTASTTSSDVSYPQAPHRDWIEPE